MSDRYDTDPSEDEILPNKLELTDQDAINEEEATGFLNAAHDAIDALSSDTIFLLPYLYDLHHNALAHLYDFAGRLRTVNMSKGGFMFAPAQFLTQTLEAFESTYLQPLHTTEWDEASLTDHLAEMHAELLYTHPFREGNGRAVRLFTRLIFLAKIGNELDFEIITKDDNFEKRYIRGVQQAANKEYDLMKGLFREMRTRFD